ncbi:DEAD/DEAH box helicase [Brachybacterium sp. MASK1Z-5]|uniref:DEAD/DEAH box helicase n=1 Tax=Brachybacterium halotolerans TaxID=2795215 RepID=A0ABS1BB25_9MICO|nr:ATP-dependent helicase C-terminal domain-containing protein [Brachybacterium halotolerans]MBK0331687.1 DEAD/DEAH box helicase [Brachybacterium halotolerans]
MTTPRPFDLAAIGAGLPVAAAREELAEAARSGALVVTAPPGTGKTTFVPPLVADLVPGRTLVTQPRRVAVRAAARRIAQLDGSRLGERVGLTVRGERHVGPQTRLEVLTPGVLLRRLLADPELEGVDAVILDEVHERSLDGDLLLGMLAEVRALREDLTVVAMSATLDAAQVADLLGGARVVDVPAPLHPLRIAHEPGAAPRLDARGVTREFLDHLARITVEHRAEEDCDALVFVTGAREVDELVRRIRSRAPDLEVLPLHGRLPAREQDRATRGRTSEEAGEAGADAASSGRVVVSTALAESSLTVPGVRLVVDAGLSREVRRDRARDMTGLVTVSASRASADQRAGRAARQGPGLAVRAYSPTDDARMPAISPPEIASADLTDAALLVAAWGSPWAAPGDPEEVTRADGGAAGEPALLAGLPLLTPPPAASATRAVEVLAGLGLVDADGRANALGRRVARLPVGVREARALLEGSERMAAPEAVAEVIAAISDDHRAPDADLPRLLRELRAGRAPGADRWRREVARLRRIAEDARARNDTAPSPTGSSTSGGSHPPHDLPGQVLALARPERIARLTATGARTYLLAGGTRAALPEGSGLTGSSWLAIAEVQRADGRAADGTGAVIRAAAPLEEDSALDLAGPLLRATRRARLEGGKVSVREERALGAIVLRATPVAATADDVGPARAAHLREHGLTSLSWSDSARTLRSRLALIHRELGDPWPAMDDASLLASLEAWLLPDLLQLRPDAPLSRLDLTAALRRLLPWPEAARLDQLAPERLAVPSGSTARIDYPDASAAAGSSDSTAADGSGRPVVAVKLQELFGLAETPRLVDGRVPVLFHLLSPARRPLAVTDDLRSFWDGPYQDVRKEMRGRYPKHPWPEDPWTAPATARTARRPEGRG